MSIKYLEKIFDMEDRIFVDVEEYFVTCSWTNNIIWMKMQMKTKWMNFYNESRQKTFFCG
jgi:hypothetical protein